MHVPGRGVPLLLAVSIAALGYGVDCAASQPLSLLPPTADDLVPSRLHTATPPAGLDHAPATASWALDPNRPLAARPRPFVAASRAYWVDADESQLQSGIALALSAPGAVIRISPHGGNAGATLAAGDLRFSIDGQPMDAAQAIRAIADEEQLRAAGLDAPRGSLAVRLTEAVGARTLVLAAPTARGRYLVHVFEPNSSIVLHLGASRDGISADQAMRLRASLDGATIAQVAGVAIAPDGHRQDIDFVRQADGSYIADFTPDAAHAAGPGVWEAHAFTASTAPNALPRDAKSAFAVSLPVARFDGTAERIGTARDATSVRFGIEAAAASRYGISGTLYGSGADGALHPVAIAHAAAWLDAGPGALVLRFSAASMGSATHAPWEIRDLRLVNQADLGLLERRERALLLSDGEAHDCGRTASARRALAVCHKTPVD